MAPIGMISILVGAVLGQRFRVLILFPVFLLAIMTIAVAALLHHSQAWSAAEASVVVIVGLQIGYLFGIGIRHLSIVLRAYRMRQHIASTLPEHFTR